MPRPKLIRPFFVRDEVWTIGAARGDYLAPGEETEGLSEEVIGEDSE